MKNLSNSVKTSTAIKMAKTEINPALNAEITNAALKAMTASGKNDKKSFNAEYNKAIKAAGFSPAYFKKVMSNIGSHAE